MKFFRKAIIFGIILFIACFAYWYFKIKSSKEKEEEEEREALFFERSDKEIVRLMLREGDKPPIIIEKRWKEIKEEEGGEEEKDWEWIILSPVETKGDRYTIQLIIQNIEKIKMKEYVYESLEKEREYGLITPSFSLRFYYKDETEEHGIDFGIESLDGEKVFAKVVGKNKIFSVPVNIRNSIKLSLFDVRDKYLCEYKSEDIVGVTLVSSSSSFILNKEGDEWYFMPDRIKASKRHVDSYIGSIRWGTFAEVIEEKGKNFSKYGLDKPRLVLNLELKDDSRFSFIAGNYVKENDEELFYATRLPDTMIFKIKSDFIYSLVKTVFELKDRRIFDFEDNDIRTLTLKGDGIISFVRDDGIWKFQDTGKELKRGYKIDTIVRGISNAEYEEREPITRANSDYRETGIEKPEYVVTLHFRDDSPPITVKLTARDAKTGKLWLTPDNGDTVYYTSGDFVSSFPETREELMK